MDAAETLMVSKPMVAKRGHGAEGTLELAARTPTVGQTVRRTVSGATVDRRLYGAL